MKKHKVRLAIVNLLAAVIVAVPALSRAQDNSTNAPSASEQTPAKPKKHSSHVASGKVSDVNTNTMMITVGKHTFDITSETKITKNGEPAVLSDITVGDKVGIAYKKTADGKLDATTVNDGKKPAEAGK